MTYIENWSYFEVAPPVHTVAYKNIDNLLKNNKNIYPYLYYSHKHMMFKKF